MSKSKYPEKIDSSAEIPAVRDNITEIGSDVLNSLRHAIFQIERTLGINPQGAAGNTVSARISGVIDNNGNLKKEALSKANVLSGPILDSDISKSAGIRESKLKLNFSTQLLQSEISILQNEIDGIVDQLNELSANFAIHINKNAKNRHNAVSINVEEAATLASNVATTSLEQNSLQDAMELLYNAHINYSGDNISQNNNSHLAQQIFFNRDSVSDFIFSDDVQGAIEDLADIESVGLRNTILNLNSNGRVRQGSIFDGYEGEAKGSLLLESSSVTYTRPNGASKTIFTLTSPIDPISEISEFDVLRLSGSELDSDNKDYQISSVTMSSGKVQSIEVYGGPRSIANSGLSIQVTKNIYSDYNINGLNCAVRPRKGRTNTPDIVIANPDSATIISSGIKPESITSLENSFDIEIDGVGPYTILTHDSSISFQTLDSIVNKINEQAVDQHLNFYAYKIKKGSCYELALSHVLPNISGDIKNRTLRISSGSLNDGIDILGLSSKTNVLYEGSTGNSFLINGILQTTFGNILSFSEADIQIIQGSLDAELFSGSFLNLGVKIGDTFVITNSSISSEDGAYRISDVTDDRITLDFTGEVLSGILDSNSIVYIIKNSSVIDELTFTESVSANGSILFDIFFTEEKDFFYKKRLEIDGEIKDGQFSAAVIDISNNFITSGESASISVDSSGYATLTGPDNLNGESVFVGTTGVYTVHSSNGLEFVKLKVNASNNPGTTISVDIYGFDEISDNNFHLSRGLYATSLGRVFGESSDSGIPSVIDKRRSGTVDDTIIGESLLERYIEGPRNELRSSGIIRGLSVSSLLLFNSGELDSEGNPIFYYTVDIDSGVAVVNGIRYEFSGVEGFRINTDQDFYLGIDSNGCIVAGDEISNPDGYTDGYLDEISPFANQSVAHLAFVNTAKDSITDLRFFIDNIDYKLLGDIRVSNSQKFGHFTDLKKAVEYARRFSSMFPDLGNPSIFIEEGLYDISSQINIDFDVKIHGAGSNVVLQKTGAFALGSEPSGDNINMRSALFLVGGSSNTSSTRIRNGVTFENFTYKTSSALENVGILFAITQDLNTSPDSVFRINNVNFIGPTSIEKNEANNSLSVGEYMVYVGQQNSTNLVPSSNIVMGNIIMSGCFIKRAGLENGAFYFTESSGSTMKNIVATGNIGVDLSPNLDSASLSLIEYPSGSTAMLDVIENGNVVST